MVIKCGQILETQRNPNTSPMAEQWQHRKLCMHDNAATGPPEPALEPASMSTR